MSENTVRKYIRQLGERGLITTESTEVVIMRYTLRHIGEVIGQHYDQQLEKLDKGVASEVTLPPGTT